MDTYEKKYKEALERARDYKNNIVHKELTVGESIMDYIFPELKECEDEKVREDIISLVNEFWEKIGSINPEYSSHSRMLAWLEKQKPIQNINKEDEEVRQYIIRTMKQKDINVPMVQKALDWLENIPYTIDHEKREGFHLGYKAALEKQGTSYTKSDVDDAYLKGISDAKNELEKQGEQKPAWSEKDEKEYKYVLKFVDNILNNCGNKKDYDHCKRCYDWLKSLKQRIGGKL